MLNALWWLFTVEVLGLVAFPLAFFLLPRLTDRGYSLSKPLGILVIGYLSWILSQAHILPSVRLSLVFLLLLMGGLSAWYGWRCRYELKKFVVEEWKLLVAIEAVFLLVFLGWALFRAYDPAIDHTEQPMDLAFLNASIRSDYGPVEDPWLKGESVSYYYFGYWMMGAVSEIAAVPSRISFNLSLALIPAMAAAGVFGLVYSVVSAEAARRRQALMAGAAAAVLLGVAANLEGVLEFMRIHGVGAQGFWDWVRVDGLDGPDSSAGGVWKPDDFWWWFRATRVINTFDGGQGIDYTIQEFPFFSFMLGDLHPHVMSIPFALLFVGFCWNFFKSPGDSWGAGDRAGALTIVAMGLALGGLAFTNMWDLPTFSVLFLGVAALRSYGTSGGSAWAVIRDVVPMGVAVIGLAVLLFLPYYLSFTGSVTGIEHVVTGTRPVHWFLVWGPLLAVVTPFVIATFVRTGLGEGWRHMAALALLVAFLPYMAWAFLHLEAQDTTRGLWGRFFHVAPFAALVGAAVYGAFWNARRNGPTVKTFALLLSAMGLLLIMGPELLFVSDAFKTRMNTVFKLYYQAWILLAAASGLAIYYWSSWRGSVTGWARSLNTAWTVVFLVLAAGALYYPAAAAASKGGPFGSGATLDGLAYVARSRPAEREAIAFVRDNVDPDSGIVEAVGEWFDAGLISRSTGVPTIFNWPGHEIQWRGSADKFKGREVDVARIYQTQDPDEVRNLLARYDVEYVYVGPRERERYGTDGLDKFRSFMETVFSREGVDVYRLRR